MSAVSSQGFPGGSKPVTVLRVLLFALLFGAASCSTPRAVGPADVQLGEYAGEPVRLQVIGVFHEPVQVVSPPGDDRLFVVERNGRVKVVRGGKTLEKPFLDVSRSISTVQEQGLLSLAFPPDFATNAVAYASFTDRKGNNRIVEYRVDPSDRNRVLPDSRRLVLLVVQNSPIHNGGQIAFDTSGMLLAGIGDGGPDAPAQSGETLLGKFVRIDPRARSRSEAYTIPADNPFVSDPGMLPEIWAYGLRNPWRWSIDRETQSLFVADVGENDSEEINVVPPALQAGANYGWPTLEGDRFFFPERPLDESRVVRPLLTYAHEGGVCAVIGGGVYRGSVGALRGAYLYGDFCDGAVRVVQVRDGRVIDQRRFEGFRIPSLVSFGEDSAGEMYVMSLDGPVYRIAGGRAERS